MKTRVIKFAAAVVCVASIVVLPSAAFAWSNSASSGGYIWMYSLDSGDDNNINGFYGIVPSPSGPMSVKVKADGTATLSGMYTGISVSASSVLMIDGEDVFVAFMPIIKGRVCTAGYPSKCENASWFERLILGL